MYISDFYYHKPKTLKEACYILDKYSDAALLAGGTDLLVEIKQGLRQHQDIIAISHLQELKSINLSENRLEIGAAVTHHEVAKSKIVWEFCSAISESASKIGSDQIRNVGTIGGNLCTGASCCDMAPILLALDASLEIYSLKGTRTVSLRDFFINHKEIRLNKEEILLKIIVNKPKPGTVAHFEKFGLREAASISVASVAVVIETSEGSCTNACVVTGAVAPTPRISEKANKILKGCKLSELTENSPILEKTGKAASEDSLPIDDIRGSADYRREIIDSLTQRAIEKAIKNSS